MLRRFLSSHWKHGSPTVHPGEASGGKHRLSATEGTGIDMNVFLALQNPGVHSPVAQGQYSSVLSLYLKLYTWSSIPWNVPLADLHFVTMPLATTEVVKETCTLLLYHVGCRR